MNSDFKSLIEAFGWEEIPSGNKWTSSFVKMHWRMNYYFTTGTVVIQNKISGSHHVEKNITEADLESLLEMYK